MWTLRRRAARVVVLDPDDRILLLSARDPADGSKGSWWELPGGGIEHGESSGRAAARELHEETGILLAEADMGPCVWTQHALYTFAGINFDSHDHVHVARTATVTDHAVDGEYRPAGLEGLEALAFRGFQWWDLPELAAWASSGGRIIPPWLPDHLPVYLASGPPDEPIDLGELGPVF